MLAGDDSGESYGFYAVLVLGAADGEEAASKAVAYASAEVERSEYRPIGSDLPLIYIAGVAKADEDREILEGLSWFKERFRVRGRFGPVKAALNRIFKPRGYSGPPKP